jgi:all-trans-retinol 13,14-reductase
MLKRFHAGLAQENWDAIVIGSGPGSLATAALLAKAGQRVLVLERHYEPGGFSHVFRRKGYSWDVGVHYIGGVAAPKQPERRLFDHLTGGKLDWGAMGEPYDVAIIDGERHEFVPGVAQQLARWIARFPKEEGAIRRYWELVRECTGAAQTYFAERALPGFIAAAAGPLMRRKFMAFARRTTYDVLRELTDNELLITVLCTQCGDYGLAPNQSSFAIHAMVVNHYRNGASYPVGGAESIGDGMIGMIEAHGGAVALRADVKELMVAGGRAIGVRLAGGEELRGKKIISGIGARNTFCRLLPADVALPAAIRAGLDTVKPSMAHLCLYLGLSKSDAELGLPKYNYWCYDPYKGDGTPGGRLPSAYISFQSAKDTAWPEKHPGKSAVQIIGPCAYGDFTRWSDTRWRRRPDDYEAMKDAFQEQALDTLHSLHPQIRPNIEWAEVSTPLSTAHFAGYPSGEIYGLEHTPSRFAQKWLRPQTFLDGLFLTGQDIVTCGVSGAVMSGVLTASAILKKNLMGEIMRK